MSCEKDLIDISTALLTPVVAAIGIYIAIQQWRINKKRFNHELFDRKFHMFQATQNFIREVLRDIKVENDDIYTFLTETKGALFIFDTEIVDYLDTLYKKAIALRASQRSKNTEEEEEVIQWFEEQIKSIDDVFKTHISIES